MIKNPLPRLDGTSEKKKNTAPKKPHSSQSKTTNKLLWTLKWLATIAIWMLIISIVIYAIYGYNLPDTSTLTQIDKQNPSIEIMAADGQFVTSYGPLMREQMTFADFPPVLVNALLAIEDRDFFNHGGLDFFAVFRAAIVNAYEGKIVQGGSTLTQQLVKNLYLSNEKSFDRKLREIILAFWIEKKLSKEEIITLYLNRVYFGAGAFGVDAASNRFFAKSARNLTLPEAALIVGLVKAPSDLNPLKYPEKAIERRNIVLNAMSEAGFITTQQEKQAQQARIAIHQNIANQNTRFFTDWIMEQLPYYVNTKEHKWLRVDTTINLSMQNKAQAIAENIVNQHALDNNVSQLGMITMSPSGEIKTMLGGIDYDLSQFNHVTLAKRQPGSAFKTFVVIEALSRGYKTNHILNDSPLVIKDWEPQNFNNQFHGNVTLRQAFIQSFNIPHIRLMQELGIGSVLSRAKDMGISSPLRRDLSTTLGTSEVTLLELTTAYAVIKNQGHLVFPFGITKVIDENGNVLYQRKGSAKTKMLLNDTVVQEIDSLLKAVVNDPSGTGKAAKLPNDIAAGKTGTSQDFRDAWFIGYDNKYITGVWLGNDDRTPMENVTGGTLPAMIWQETMVGY